MIIEQVTERTYFTEETIGNVGAISMPNYAVVIDSGMYPEMAQEYRNYIEKTTGTPVLKLILTHCHGDHVFGNQIFKDCQLIASNDLEIRMKNVAEEQWTREKLEETAQMRPDVYGQLNLDKLEITFPKEIFDDSFILTDEGVEIITQKVGGHTKGSAYVYFPAESVLFVGDLIFAQTFPWGGDPTADLDAWIQALKGFQHMDIDWIIPGHGPKCDLKEVQTYLNFFEPVAKVMKEMIADSRSMEEVIEFDDYPEFYPSDTPERHRDSLAQWYRVYKRKHEQK